MRLIDAEKEIAKLREMLDVLIDEGDKTAARFALNILNDADTVDSVYDEEWRKKHYESSYNQGFLDGYKTHARAQWIPCSERLPEEPGRYMVTDKEGNVRFAMYSTKIPMWWGGANQPTAWTPMPEPYKEDTP